jgi:hypothetical protein
MGKLLKMGMGKTMFACSLKRRFLLSVEMTSRTHDQKSNPLQKEAKPPFGGLLFHMNASAPSFRPEGGTCFLLVLLKK